MSDADNLDEQDAVVDLMHNPVVANWDSVGFLFATQRDAARWSWSLGEQVNGGADPLLLRARQSGDRLDCTAGDLNLIRVAHARPRSALTSSQGT